jgi:hypothetical protein
MLNDSSTICFIAGNKKTKIVSVGSIYRMLLWNKNTVEGSEVFFGGLQGLEPWTLPTKGRDALPSELH